MKKRKVKAKIKGKSKTKVKKELITPEKIELLIPGAEFEQTCTEDVVAALRDIPDELKPGKGKRRKDR